MDDRAVDNVIAEVENWAKMYAAKMVGVTDEFYDELVQEARIQVWKTYAKKQDVNHSYLITVMKWRMLDVVRAHTKNKKKYVGVDFNDLDFSMLLAAADNDDPDWAYHHEQILKVIGDFRPELQEYLLRRFWHGQSDAQIAREMNVYPSRVSRWWSNQIRPKLAVSLAYLNEE